MKQIKRTCTECKKEKELLEFRRLDIETGVHDTSFEVCNKCIGHKIIDKENKILDEVQITIKVTTFLKLCDAYERVKLDNAPIGDRNIDFIINKLLK